VSTSISASVSASPSAPPVKKPPKVKKEKIGLNVKQTKVGVTLTPTTSTSTSGYPVKYDNGVKYDSGIKYDRWFGSVNQGETPHLNIKQKQGIINIKGVVPKIKIKNE
jgi:hypothetical protein